jgi:glycosyltransferase involved in cell wall biosynthesis
MNATSNGRVTSSRPLTICKIWDADYPWDIRIEKISESLVAAGHTVHLVCRNAERRPRREAHGRFVIHRLPAIHPALGPAHALCNFPHPISPVWTKIIWRVVRETHADVILVRDLPLAIPAALVGRWLSVPVVLDMAEHYAAMLADRLRYTPTSVLDRFLRQPGLARLVERWALRLVDRVIVVVEESRDRLLAAGVAPERLTVVSNTPRLDQWDPIESGAGSSTAHVAAGLRLIYLGNLDGSRGVDVVIRAIDALGQRGAAITFHVIGQGPRLDSLRQLARDLGVADRVHIEGRLPYSRVRAAMAQADVGVIPHYVTEAWNSTIPNKLFDYMLARLPVLVSDTAPTARIVEAEGCGMVFRDRNVEDLARCLVTLADPAVRRNLGSRGHLAVQQRLHWGVDSQHLLRAVEGAVWRDVPEPTSSRT